MLLAKNIGTKHEIMIEFLKIDQKMVEIAKKMMVDLIKYI